MPKNLLVFGKGGQLGSNFIELLENNSQYNSTFPTLEECDFSDEKNVRKYLENLKIKPDFIINCSAYTAVDKAEDEKELCYKINTGSVAEIANFCAKNNVTLIHYSTDYVFNGSGEKPFSEDNIKDLEPLNYYGFSKLESEKLVEKSECKNFIFRISWVYNHVGKNFPFTMIRLASEKEELKIVADQIGSPCYSLDIAKATLEIIRKNSTQYGIYHLTPHEYISWFEFTKMIVEKAKKYDFPIKVKNILPINTSDYPVRAERPLNSRLDSDKIFKAFGIKLPSIDTSLEEFFKKIKV